MSAMPTASTNSTSKADDPSRPIREGFAEVKKDAQSVKEDLEVLKEDAAQMTAHATKQAVEAVKCGAQSAGDLARTAGQTAKNCHGSMCEHVKSRPTSSVLLALGAGVVLGRILAARR